jgi:metal-sulfur cluster biosynthetic enzyme
VNGGQESFVVDELVSPAQVETLVRSVADGIYDPCSMAIGLNVGLTEMGLIREITVEPGVDGWRIDVRIRLTSPGCQYFFYFQQELEARLLSHPTVAEVAVHWDERLDWTPEDLAPSAREKIAARQQRLRPIPNGTQFVPNHSVKKTSSV